jgi:hypothetical protein
MKKVPDQKQPSNDPWAGVRGAGKSSSQKEHKQAQ